MSDVMQDDGLQLTSSRTNLIFAGAVIALVLIGLFAYRSLNALADGYIFVDAQHKMLGHLDELLDSVAVAQGSSRGYVITGKQRFVEPYQMARDQSLASLASLDGIAGDYPVHREALARLRPLIEEKLQIQDALIRAYDAQGFEAARQVIEPGRGVEIMMTVREIIQEISRLEHARLEARMVEVRQIQHDVAMLIGLGGVFALIMLVMARTTVMRELAQRQAAAKALNQVSTLQRAILDGANFTIISTDVDGTIRIFNAGAQQMLGYSEEEVVGKVTPAIIHVVDEVVARAEVLSQELGSQVEPGFESFVAKARLGMPDENEWTYVRKDGSCFPVRLSVTALRDAEGHINGYLGVGYDLTETKRIEARGVAQQRLLDMLHKATSGFVASSDPRAIFDFMLTEVLALTGSEYGFIGEVLHDGADAPPYLRTHAISNIAWNAETRKFYEENAPIGMVFRNLDTLFGAVMRGGEVVISNDPAQDPRAGGLPEGHPALNAFLGIPIHYGGVLVGMYGISNRAGGYDQDLVAFLQPFTSTCGVMIDALRAEQRRARTTQDLKDSQARVHAILDNVLEGIITINEDRIVESMNPAAEHIFGYAAADVIGNNVNMLMPDAVASQHDRYVQNYLDTGVAKIIGIGREVTGRRADGSEFPMELAVSEVRLGGSRIFTGIVRDITERKKLDRMKNEFISTVSHELRTPLTSIRGSLGLVAGGAVGEIPDKARELVDIACKNSERLVRLINDILDIEKIESGKMVFDIQAQPLMPLVRQALEANQGYGEQLGVGFAITAELAEARVAVDADRILQVLTNLMSNAAKFSTRGQTVEVAVTEHARAVRVAVRDHGAGLPEEFQGRIFQRFAQADSSDQRQKGGTGLGLSIAKAIVEKHGGAIGYETWPGEGTLFYFDLPVLSEPRTVVPADALPADAPRILVCEDDPDVAMLLAMLLGQQGYATEIAYSAEQAKATLAAGRFAAMTLDLRLPGQDGLSFISELRAADATHDLPIVVVSATAEQGREALNGGAIAIMDWLQKPIDQQRLQQAIRMAMYHRDGSLPVVLHVEDDPDVIKVVDVILAGHAHVVPAQSLAAARERLHESRYDMVLLDISLPDGSGLDLLEEINQLSPAPPVAVFSAHDVAAGDVDMVSAALVKARTSNTQLLETVRHLIEQHSSEPDNPAA